MAQSGPTKRAIDKEPYRLDRGLKRSVPLVKGTAGMRGSAVQQKRRRKR